MLDFNTDLNARAEFYWSHGLVSDPTYNLMKTGCNYSSLMRESFTGSVSSTCEVIYSTVFMEISKYIDKYDVTLESCVSSLRMQKSKMMMGVKVSSALKLLFSFSVGFILKRVQSINYSNLAEQRIGTTVAKPDVCVQDEASAYLNMLDVQKAFHARLVGSVKRWDACSEYVWFAKYNF